MTKDELIEKHRDINVDYDGWWDSVYEDFITDMETKGIPLKRESIEFSGFGSQGDGARFVCDIGGGSFLKFIEVHELVDKYPMLKLAEEFDCVPRITSVVSDRRYCHYNTVTVEVGRCYTFKSALHHLIEEWDARYIMMDSFDKQWHEQFDSTPFYKNGIDTEVSEILKGYMKQLYQNLEAEYFSLTSEEVVWDTIVANDMHIGMEEEDAA